jgi:hypothetical protein
MRYSVCVIDNDIPASGTQAEEFGIIDTALLNGSNLQLLLQRTTWADDVIRNLIATLLSQRDTDGISPRWDVFGFTNPSFYINSINGGFFRSDLIVFDWEYPGAQNATETNSESILREILERTFCLIFIFSKADKKAEIDEILAKPEFQPYKERLYYLDKSVEGLDQTGVLLQKADEMYEQNFSFKFAGELRRKSVQCADQILSDMGRASLNDVKNLLVVSHGGKKDLIDFLAERFRTSIAGQTIYDLVDQIPETTGAAPAIDETLASHVWSYRLYFQQENGDDLVRRGDIVAVGNEVLLVLSADCDLVRFWAKNFGIINAVSLHGLDQSNTTLKDMLKLCVTPNLAQPVNSLLSKVGDLSEGPFVLPFVPKGGALKHFIAIPKDLLSRRIPTPAGWDAFPKNVKKSHPMKYAYWEGAERLCTISEPFLTPVVQHVFNTLGGNGVPDYPEHMKGILKKILADFSATPAAAPAAAVQPPAAIAGVPVEPLSIDSSALSSTAASVQPTPEAAAPPPPLASMPTETSSDKAPVASPEPKSAEPKE